MPDLTFQGFKLIVDEGNAKKALLRVIPGDHKDALKEFLDSGQRALVLGTAAGTLWQLDRDITADTIIVHGTFMKSSGVDMEGIKHLQDTLSRQVTFVPIATNGDVGARIMENVDNNKPWDYRLEHVRSS